MQRPSAQTVALLLAVMMSRFGKSRARISNLTLRKIARRTQFRTKFMSDVRSDLEEWGYILVSLDRGGFGLQATSSLEGAPPIVAKDFLAEEMAAFKKGALDEEALSEELTNDFVDPDDE